MATLPGKVRVGSIGMAILAALVLLNALSAFGRIELLPSWLLSAALLSAFLATVGWGINGRPVGVFIDNRNRVSLSKFQAGMWTVLVLSGLIAAATGRIARDFAAPIEIEIPVELLIAMGISAASLVATPAILSSKTEEPAPPAAAVEDAARMLGQSPDVGQATGAIFGRTEASYAEWLDMFRGDEVSNASAPDLSKVQQFLITLILGGIYAASLWQVFADGNLGDAAKMTLPTLSSQFVWLLGISHAGYLSYKIAPHGKRSPGTESVALEDGAVG